ncbi:MAG: serine/threonine-protein phosphatase [Pseudomonadales bacterium]|nr:serine/threonine-protein phosphatase [Pseudomonadales bacterium]
MSPIQRFVNYIKQSFFFDLSAAALKNTVSAEASDKGCVRKRNEDSILSRSSLGLWAVADGMGGHLAGDYASQEIVAALAILPAKNLHQNAVSATIAALEQAHDKIKAYSQTELDGKTVGSTVVVLLLDKENAHCLWVGDSRLYRFRDNILEPLSLDHSQAFALLEQGVLSLDEVDDHPSSHVLTRAMGSGDFHPDYQCFELKKGDKFLLCSDGLYGELSSDEIAGIIKTGTVEDNVQELLQQTLNSGARDNVSVILVDTDGR